MTGPGHGRVPEPVLRPRRPRARGARRARCCPARPHDRPARHRRPDRSRSLRLGASGRLASPGRRWRRPAVDLVGLRAADPAVARWVDDLQVPKVLVATQTRVGEAVVDEVGAWVPSVPMIAVVAAGRAALGRRCRRSARRSPPRSPSGGPPAPPSAPGRSSSRRDRCSRCRARPTRRRGTRARPACATGDLDRFADGDGGRLRPRTRPPGHVLVARSSSARSRGPPVGSGRWTATTSERSWPSAARS